MSDTNSPDTNSPDTNSSSVPSPLIYSTVYWATLRADVTFFPGEELPPQSEGKLWAVLTFVFYGDKVALADITGRGLCIPSGKIEAGETVDEAAVREVWEETGGKLDPERRRLIGCYRLSPRGEPTPGPVRYCPVFVAEAWEFAAIPERSESRGIVLAAVEDVADVYFTWDALMGEVFQYAQERRTTLFPVGLAMSRLTG